MRRLTKDEMQDYVVPRNDKTGVAGITEEMLLEIDLDTVDIITKEGDVVTTNKGYKYKFDSFTPRSGSYAFKPSFGGRQILIGKFDDGKLLFSNGKWFLLY